MLQGLGLGFWGSSFSSFSLGLWGSRRAGAHLAPNHPQTLGILISELLVYDLAIEELSLRLHSDAELQ